MRYAQLLAAVRKKQPKAILEIGTWNGRQALAMLNLSPKSIYYGFDLFESASAETDSAEMNVKPHYRWLDVLDYLHPHEAYLYKGNTRVTLSTFVNPVDFVWMDGGHSVETVASDWENVKRVATPDAWIYLDDYYTGPIDTRRYGCNSLVETLEHEVLPEKDQVRGGGWVQMVRVNWPQSASL